MSTSPLKGSSAAGSRPSGLDHVERLRALVLDVGPGGVEVRVVGDDVALVHGHA